MILQSHFNRWKLLIDLSLRNLFRQKRRNILLGTAIAFGMMILILANSFSHGISDTLFNRIVVWMTGHVEVAVMERGKFNQNIIRDKARIEKIIKENITDMRFISESVSTFLRALGNGKGENLALVGIDLNGGEAGEGTWKIIAGNQEDFTNGKFEWPMILYEDKAHDLNVKLHDTVRIRLNTIYGQEQTAQLKVVAILQTEGMFMSMAAFTPLEKIKKLMDYKPYESGSLQVILKDPLTSIKQADKLHKALAPNLALIYGEARSGSGKADATVLPFIRSAESYRALTNYIRPVEGQIFKATNDETVLLNTPLAEKLNVRTGEKIKYIYKNKFENRSTTNTYKIAGIFRSKEKENLIMMYENNLYDTFNKDLPVYYQEYADAFKPAKDHPLYPALATEWRLFPRTATHEAMENKYKKLTRVKWQGAAMDVRSMYESADQIVSLEKALNIITMAAVLLLFFIILIGVVNTLRMTIRERTREIGTVRAIGMQRADVRNIFMLETFFLALLSSIVGLIAGFIIMGLLFLPKIKTTSVLGILLVNQRLHFAPTIGGIIFSFIVILVISTLTALFPARRAARLSAANALRHYE